MINQVTTGYNPYRTVAVRANFSFLILEHTSGGSLRMTHIPTLIAVSCLFVASQAQAKCSPEIETLEAKVEAAEFVFVAWVESASATKTLDDPTTVRAKYQTLQMFKGQAEDEGFVSSNLTTGGMQITPGLVYLFFMYPESNRVGFCGGSRRLDWYNAHEAGIRYEEVEEEQRLLSSIREFAAE